MNTNPETRKELLKKFLCTYDTGHNLSFNNVKFRPAAKRTTGFGIDTTTTQYTPLRIHVAIDSARSNSTGYKIFAPFEIDRTEYLEDYSSFGTLLFLHTPYDFHIRIAHMETKNFSEENLERVRSGDSFKAKELIGECGEAGLSFGRHAHVEIVSDKNDFTILDDILAEKFDDIDPYDSYSEEQIQTFIDNTSVESEKGWELYNKESERRGVKILNQYLSYRWDYHYQEMRTFYSSMALFGM